MNRFTPGQTVLYDSGSYAGVGKPLPPLQAKVLKVTPQRVQVEFYDPGYKATVRRFVRPDKLTHLPETQYTDAAQLQGYRNARGILVSNDEPAEVSIRRFRDDDLPTINGLESELTALRRLYADQSDELATMQDERDALMKVMVGLHDMLNQAGIPQQGDLTKRVTAALERLQKAEREMDDLSHDVGVFIYAGTHVDKNDAESLRSPETIELYNILRDARQRQVTLEMETKYVPVWAALWKRAAKRWRESYHALDILHAHRELERDRWKAAAKRFRRRWRDACAELDEPERGGWTTHYVTTTLKIGDRVMTPHGEGEVRSFDGNLVIVDIGKFPFVYTTERLEITELLPRNDEGGEP